MTDGFLGRWSRRKLDAVQGKTLDPLPPAEAPVIAAQPPVTELPVPTASDATDDPAAPPAPTLEEAQALTPDADFRRFAARDVAPEVKNAALKKLFADPRYNVMDGLDVYTGDYAQPDPLPESMLRELASAKFLGFFADEDKQARDDADDPAAQTVAQSQPVPPAVPAGQDAHANADLRLQQDHAAAGEDPGRGAERKPGTA